MAASPVGASPALTSISEQLQILQGLLGPTNAIPSDQISLSAVAQQYLDQQSAGAATVQTPLSSTTAKPTVNLLG